MGKYNKEELEQLLLKETISYEELGRKYNCSGSNIKKIAIRLGIILPQRRKINKNETFNKGTGRKKFCLNCGKLIPIKNTYCNNHCQTNYEYGQWIIRWKQDSSIGIRGQYGISNYIKRFLFEKFDNKCSICSWSKINPTSNTLPLEIEHIDGNFENNLEENLTLLCPNCHSLTPTYKGANKGNGRKNRKKYSK